MILDGATTFEMTAAIRRADGEARVVAGCGGRLRDLYQRQPIRVLLPKPAAGEPLTAVLANLSGGMVGGDRYRTTIAVDDGADLTVCGQAAEKVYRSTGDDTAVSVDLSVGAGARLEWLPQGTILFDGCRLRRRTTIDLTPGARLLAGEILVFGRLGMGEVMRHGIVDDQWRVRSAGRLVWADAFRADGDVTALLDHPAGLAGGRALATGLVAADGAEDLLDDVREALDGQKGPGLHAAATAWPGLLLIRVLAPDPAAVRRVFGDCWSRLRTVVLGRPARLPVLWHI